MERRVSDDAFVGCDGLAVGPGGVPEAETQSGRSTRGLLWSTSPPLDSAASFSHFPKPKLPCGSPLGQQRHHKHSSKGRCALERPLLLPFGF